MPKINRLLISPLDAPISLSERFKTRFRLDGHRACRYTSANTLRCRGQMLQQLNNKKATSKL